MNLLYFFQFFYKFNNLDIYLQIPIFVILIILLVSTIYDLKLGIVPDYLSKLLILFGIIYHIIISLIYSNYYFLINSIISGILIFILSFILWIIRFLSENL